MKASTRVVESDAPVLLFDGVCKLCNGSVRIIIERDLQARFRFASLQFGPGQALLEGTASPPTTSTPWCSWRGTRFQILRKLREAEVELAKGQTTGEVARKLGITEQTARREGAASSCTCAAAERF